MADVQETRSERFTPEALLDQIKESDGGECFAMISGEVGAKGETTIVGVSSYHAPLHELIDAQSSMKHYGIAMGFLDMNGERTEGEPVPLPSADITLTIPAEGRGYAFDAADPSLRMLRATVSVYKEEIPVRLARLDLSGGFTLFWMHRDVPVA